MKVLIIGDHGKVKQRISKLTSTAEQFKYAAFIEKRKQNYFLKS